MTRKARMMMIEELAALLDQSAGFGKNEDISTEN
jgi:hypothetical protein